MATWRVEDAKTLNDVIERAHTEGPQMITRHGVERAVVLSTEDYHALASVSPMLTREPSDIGIAPAQARGQAEQSEQASVAGTELGREAGGGRGGDQGSRRRHSDSAPVSVSDEDFKTYLLGGPKIDDFSIQRDRDPGRAVEL